MNIIYAVKSIYADISLKIILIIYIRLSLLNVKEYVVQKTAANKIVSHQAAYSTVSKWKINLLWREATNISKLLVIH